MRILNYDPTPNPYSLILSMTRGDQIYVMRPLAGLTGVYEHHGIDCGDGTVIHYSKVTDPPTVRQTSLASFAMGNPIYLKRQPISYIPDVVLQRAESRLGEQRYNLLTNNCEHFANWCKTGRNESQQLADFGLDTRRISSIAASQLIDEAMHGGDIVKATSLLKNAQGNVAIAQTQIQSQYEQARKEMSIWHRVAQLAMKQGKEHLARAALERKVQYKRKVDDLEAQLGQLAEMQATLDRNHLILEKNIIQ
jgi:hypothetical protein